MPAPSEIRLSKDRRRLTVTFPDGKTRVIPAELLRVESPSAEVQGHDPSQKRLVTGKADVTITAIEPVGRYAVRLVFDDGHDTGIYSWSVLERFVREGDAMDAAYRAAVAAG